MTFSCEWKQRFEADGAEVEVEARAGSKDGSYHVAVIVYVIGKAWPGKAVHLLGRLGALGLAEAKSEWPHSMTSVLMAEPWNRGAAISCWRGAIEAAEEVLA